MKKNVQISFFSLNEQNYDLEFQEEFYRSSKHLFGSPGSSDSDKAILHISNATLPVDLRKSVAYELEKSRSSMRLSSEDILNSLTSIRRQIRLMKNQEHLKRDLYVQ